VGGAGGRQLAAISGDFCSSPHQIEGTEARGTVNRRRVCAHRRRQHQRYGILLTMPPGQGSGCHDPEDDHEMVESASDREDDTFGGTAHKEVHGQRELQTNIEALDDDTLFAIVKKIVCVGVRKIISSANAPIDGINTVPNGGGGCGISGRGSRLAPKKTITKLNVSFFSEVIQSLNPDKRTII